MSLRILTRKSKMGLLPVEKDVCLLLFETKKAQHACRLFLNAVKVHRGLSRREMSRFAWDLDAGKLERGFRYSRSRFYRETRKTLISNGLLSLEARMMPSEGLELSPERKRRKSVVRKYVAVHQPITKRPPDGLNLPRLIWIVCEKWNREFFGET